MHLIIDDPNAGLVEVPAPGGVLSLIPFTPQWYGRQMAEAMAEQYPETVITTPETPEVLEPFVEGAVDIATAAIIVTGVGAVVTVSVLGLGALALWKWG